MLNQKLDNGDLALAMIMDDPILCMEFLRNTKDLNANKELWPKKPFKYRPYQKDLLSDTSKHISLEGGRSIGKCQPANEKIYTVDGYQKIGDLVKQRFRLWAWNEKEGFVPRNAYCWFNGNRKIWDIKTAYTKISATKLHPILTSEGWKYASDIQVGDRIAKVTKLPHVPAVDIPEYEVRMIAYMMFKPFRLKQYTQYWYPFKSTAVKNDVKRQLEKMGVIALEDTEGRLNFHRKTKGSKYHPLSEVLNSYGFYWIRRFGWNTSNKQFRLPEQLRRMSETNLRQFFESFFAEYADVSSKEIRARIQSEDLAKDMQECLLRFGIETYLEDRIDTGYTGNKKRNVDLVTRDKRAVYRALKEFNIPGYTIGKLSLPEQSFDPSPIYRFETVTEVKKNRLLPTYALNVDKDNTYISNNLIVHNTYILEDKILWDVLHNEDIETAQILLATANQSQMTPVLTNINSRFLSSKFLRGYVVGKGLNKIEGTMKYDFKGREVTLHARLAGMKTESNMVGLHLPKIRIDEAQLFPIGAYNQVTPVINQWEENTQMFLCGVPNGMTTSALYQVSQRTPKFKKYRIPAPNNPFFTRSNYIQAIKDYGGEDSDLFKQLVLGQWGTSAEQVITRDELAIESYPFYNYRFSSQEKLKGLTYKEVLDRPIINSKNEFSMFIAGIDTGFVDPTIIQVFGLKNGKWYLVVRYRLARIEYPEQWVIIDWLHQHFKFSKICIDIGSGGSGATIMQSLCYLPEYKDRRYNTIIEAVQFNEHLAIGYAQDNSEIKQDTKTIGATELVKFLQAQHIVLAEIDGEGVSELERIARSKSLNGQTKYFILSRTGRGVASDDHIFASFICFTMGIRDMSYLKQRKKRLGKTI